MARTLYDILKDYEAEGIANSIDRGFTAPAREYEARHGLTGVSHTYQLPEGYSEHSLQDALKERTYSTFSTASLLDLAENMNSIDAEETTRIFDRLEERYDALIEEAETIGDGGNPNEFLTMSMKIYQLEEQMKLVDLMDEMIEECGEVTHQDIRDLHEKAQQNCDAFIDAVYAQMVELNPELEVFEPESTMQRFHILSGAISAFNVADISFFSIDDMDGVKAANEVVGWKERVEAIESETGHMGWVPAPSTLLKLEQQLDRRQAQSVER